MPKLINENAKNRDDLNGHKHVMLLIVELHRFLQGTKLNIKRAKRYVQTDGRT